MPNGPQREYHADGKNYEVCFGQIQDELQLSALLVVTGAR